MIDAKAVALEIAEDAFLGIEYLTVCERIFDLPLNETEEYNLIEEVWDLIGNARITVTFEGESE